jgi:accessory gene regulator protein AgrB
VQEEKTGPSLLTRLLALVILVVAAWVLLKVVINVVAGLATLIVVVLAVFGIIWALGKL